MSISEGLLQLAALFIFMAAVDMVLNRKKGNAGREALPEDSFAQIFIDKEEQE